MPPINACRGSGLMLSTNRDTLRVPDLRRHSRTATQQRSTVEAPAHGELSGQAVPCRCCRNDGRGCGGGGSEQAASTRATDHFRRARGDETETTLRIIQIGWVGCRFAWCSRGALTARADVNGQSPSTLTTVRRQTIRTGSYGQPTAQCSVPEGMKTRGWIELWTEYEPWARYRGSRECSPPPSGGVREAGPMVATAS
jgi:hypothetical protein